MSLPPIWVTKYLTFIDSNGQHQLCVVKLPMWDTTFWAQTNLAQAIPQSPIQYGNAICNEPSITPSVAPHHFSTVGFQQAGLPTSPAIQWNYPSRYQQCQGMQSPSPPVSTCSSTVDPAQESVHYSIYHDPSVVQASADFGPSIINYSPQPFNCTPDVRVKTNGGAYAQQEFAYNYDNQCAAPPEENFFDNFPSTHPFLPFAEMTSKSISSSSKAKKVSKQTANYFRPIPPKDPDCSVQSVNDKAFYFENIRSGIFGFISFRYSEFAFSHWNGQVFKDRRVLICNLILSSGVTCYVKFTPRNIRFSSNLGNIAYLIDEAGVRTCWESFEALDHQLAKKMWKRQCDNEDRSSMRALNYDYVRNGTDRRQKRYKTQIKSHEISGHEPIVFNQKGFELYSKNSEFRNLTAAWDGFSLKYVSQVHGSGSHLEITNDKYRFHQQLWSNFNSVHLKFHTQTARLDYHGKLSLSNPKKI